jgi:hypothetical protein
MKCILMIRLSIWQMYCWINKEENQEHNRAEAEALRMALDETKVKPVVVGAS